MTNHAYDATDPLTTDARIQDRVEALIGPAISRRLWLLFVDTDDRQVPAVAPIEDYPLAPGDGVVDGVVAAVRRIADEVGAHQVIFVWERPTGAGITAPDRAWARQVAVACREGNVAVRAQLISHRNGVRWFAPDDYASGLLDLHQVDGRNECG